MPFFHHCPDLRNSLHNYGNIRGSSASGNLSAMARISRGSVHLFRVAGIDVFLHWSWFLVAFFEILGRLGKYSSFVWNVLEYLALFAIVLLHEFGHALACRQVGGTANQITLWPLGGVAFVAPPQRPGVTLWSIAAGPLVNLALLPFLIGASFLSRYLGWPGALPDVYLFIQTLLGVNAVLFVFNVLPIYPLDGGQILRSLLWYFIGRGRSLVAATVLGMIGAVALVGVAVWLHLTWWILIAGYMLLCCWGGFKGAIAIIRSEKLPRRMGVACPNCGAVPPTGALWKCHHCGWLFDTFETQATCPHCGTQYHDTMCGECHQMHPLSEWIVPDAHRISAASTRD